MTCIYTLACVRAATAASLRQHNMANTYTHTHMCASKGNERPAGRVVGAWGVEKALGHSGTQRTRCATSWPFPTRLEMRPTCTHCACTSICSIFSAQLYNKSGSSTKTYSCCPAQSRLFVIWHDLTINIGRDRLGSIVLCLGNMTVVIVCVSECVCVSLGAPIMFGCKIMADREDRSVESALQRILVLCIQWYAVAKRLQ